MTLRQRRALGTNASFGRHAITDEFLIRPSWCDARLCLDLIEQVPTEEHNNRFWLFILVLITLDLTTKESVLK